MIIESHTTISVGGPLNKKSWTFKNTVLNSGKNMISKIYFADCFKFCHLGFHSPLVPTEEGQTSLYGEILKTGDLDFGVGTNGYSKPPNKLRLSRGFSFPTVADSITFNEIGFSPLGGDLFSRVVLPTSISILQGQQIRVQYSLEVTFLSTPWEESREIHGQLYKSKTVIQDHRLALVDPTGNTFVNSGENCNEPSTEGFISLYGTPLPESSIPNPIPRTPFSTKRAKLLKYEDDSFTAVKFAIFTEDEIPEEIHASSLSDKGGLQVENGIESYYPNPILKSGKALVVMHRIHWGIKPPSPYSFIHWLDYDDMIRFVPSRDRINSFVYTAL